ncbi:MAG: DUF2905 domain-containing protein, partial [Egibacteraceae bacterium]
MDRSLGPLLIALGVTAILVGLAASAGWLSWLGRLPGDLRFEGRGGRVYVPITSMINPPVKFYNRHIYRVINPLARFLIDLSKNSKTMWRNYIKVTIRNLSRNKAFNLINISGLAIGLASSVFIILYIVHQLNFDRFHENGQQMYRLYIDGKMAGEELRGAWNSPVFG